MIILVIGLLSKRNKKNNMMKREKQIEEIKEKAKLGLVILETGISKFSELFQNTFLKKIEEINNLKIHTYSEKITTQKVSEFYLENVQLEQNLLNEYKTSVDSFIKNHDKNLEANKQLLHINLYEFFYNLELMIFKINQDDLNIMNKSREYKEKIDSLLKENSSNLSIIIEENKNIQNKLSDLENKIHSNSSIKDFESEKISQFINSEIEEYKIKNNEEFQRLISRFNVIFDTQLAILLEKIRSKEVKLTNIIIQAEYGNTFNFVKDFEDEINEYKNKLISCIEIT